MRLGQELSRVCIPEKRRFASGKTDRISYTEKCLKTTNKIRLMVQLRRENEAI